MRGLLLGVLVLVGMDVLLSAPASRVATIFNRPTQWLAAWMDPGQPLIPAGHLGQDTGTGGGQGGGPGKCPPGSIWDARTRRCLRELG